MYRKASYIYKILPKLFCSLLALQLVSLTIFVAYLEYFKSDAVIAPESYIKTSVMSRFFRPIALRTNISSTHRHF